MLHHYKMWVLCFVSFLGFTNLLFTIYHSKTHCKLISKNGQDHLEGCPINILDLCQGVYSVSIPRDISDESPDFNYLCPWSPLTTISSLPGLSLTQIYLFISIWAKKRRRAIRESLPPWIWCVILLLVLGMALMIKDLLIGHQYKQDLYKQSDFPSSHMWNLSLYFCFIACICILASVIRLLEQKYYSNIPTIIW